MPTKRLTISAFVLGGVLALPLTAARAVDAEPINQDQARAAAQESRDQAEHYRSLGGVGYKTGLEQRAEADAARYDARAEELAPTPTVSAALKEAAREEKVEAHYHALGAVTYKTGAEQRAEARVRAAEEPAPAGETPNPSCMPTKPIVDFLCERSAAR
jgi:hypothetical protein